MAEKYVEQNCSRKVLTSKYERNAPEIQNWWYRLFDLLESDAAIPPDRRLDVVKDIFPEKLLSRILSILSFIRTCKAGKEDVQATYKDREEELSNLSVHYSWEKDKQREEIGPNNPYLRFFHQKPERAAIWHKLPPLSLEEMNLIQRTQAITEMIASDFVKWMQDISDEDSPTTLTVPLVLKMFEIGFDTDAARSLQVCVKEMVSVPDGVAVLRNAPEMSKRSQLHRQLRRDLKASKRPKKVFAFGTKIDKNFQFHPPKTSEIEKWMICKNVPADLESMSVVWQGITHLRSTRAFCRHLLDHPDIKPPKFLIDNKLMDSVFLKKALEQTDATVINPS